MKNTARMWSKDVLSKSVLMAMVFVAFFMAASPLLSAPVFAEPLSADEMKAVNQYPNWVADACTGSVGAAVTGGLIPDDQIPGRDPREKIWNYLISLGFSPVEAAGIEGNIGREGVYDPTNIEDPAGTTKDWDVFLALTGQDQGYGLIGFTPGRSLAKGDTVGADWSGIADVDVNRDNFYFMSTQLSVVRGYMKNSTAPSGKNMLQEFKERSTNPGNAALAFEDLVENPGVLASDERIQFANDAMRDFGGNTPAQVPTAAAGTPGSNCSCPSNGAAGGAAGGGSLSPNLVGNTPAEQSFNYFVSQGLPAKAAAGIVGNFMTESGGNTENLDTHAHNDISGTHDGIAQWSTSRWNELKSHERGDPYDLANQLDFAWYELNHGYSSVLDQIKNAGSAADAATIVNNDYEVSGDTSGNREANAQTIIAKYGGNTPGAAGGGCGAVSNGACNSNAPVYGSVNGSGDEYSQEQLASIFGDPGTASSHPVMDNNLTNVDFLGHEVQANKKMAPCLEAVAAQLKSENVHYDIRLIGCYRYDSDNGGSNIGLSSYHTYGVACDINWDTNPWSGSGAELPHDMPEAYIKAFHDHGFTWGGDWVSVKDYMHFEFNGIKP